MAISVENREVGIFARKSHLLYLTVRGWGVRLCPRFVSAQNFPGLQRNTISERPVNLLQPPQALSRHRTDHFPPPADISPRIFPATFPLISAESSSRSERDCEYWGKGGGREEVMEDNCVFFGNVLTTSNQGKKKRRKVLHMIEMYKINSKKVSFYTNKIIYFYF